MPLISSLNCQVEGTKFPLGGKGTTINVTAMNYYIAAESSIEVDRVDPPIPLLEFIP